MLLMRLVSAQQREDLGGVAYIGDSPEGGKFSIHMTLKQKEDLVSGSGIMERIMRSRSTTEKETQREQPCWYRWRDIRGVKTRGNSIRRLPSPGLICKMYLV